MQNEESLLCQRVDSGYAWPPAKLAGNNLYSNMHATFYKKEKGAAVSAEVVFPQTPFCASSRSIPTLHLGIGHRPSHIKSQFASCSAQPHHWTPSSDPRNYVVVPRASTPHL